jgi:hypothetical protein
MKLNQVFILFFSLYNVSKLHAWISRPDCLDIRKNATSNILNVAKSFLAKKKDFGSKLKSRKFK